RNNFENASKGSVDIGITMKGLLNEVGKGALIGTVVYIGISAFSNYKKYKNGDMTYNEFGRTLLKDGSKGGVMGGSMAAINTGIQWSFVKLGLGAGNPLAIPVMIIVSYGLKKIIDPLFKDGQYAETLNSIRYYDDLAKGWLNFGKMSFYLYENQIKQLETIQIYKNRSENINKLSSLIDDNLENKIKEI
ncbi:MAG: hypothetical protein KDK36_17515, partial [Leptospiraceae bacterium]|nr:hypothetical protein [Leptospiraceae bacterium]